MSPLSSLDSIIFRQQGSHVAYIIDEPELLAINFKDLQIIKAAFAFDFF